MAINPHNRKPLKFLSALAAVTLGLYGLLERVTGSPMVALNRAIAAAMADGPQAGLELLAELEQPLAGHHRLHATRAHLRERADEGEAAGAEYRRAAELTNSVPERDYLTMRAARPAQSPGIFAALVLRTSEVTMRWLAAANARASVNCFRILLTMKSGGVTPAAASAVTRSLS